MLQTKNREGKKKIKVSLRLNSQEAFQTRKYVENYGLHTVCQEANCPNLSHCWSRKTATFMIMGKDCTRSCRFCNISTARPAPLDTDEPQKLAQTIFDMQIKHVVITSVDRDELEDCGSEHFAECILAVQQKNPETSIEVLIPDFKGKEKNLEKIWATKPDIINHNLETVASLYKTICPQSNYKNSLLVLKKSADKGFLTKSGIILGLGEKIEEVYTLIDDLVTVHTKMLTIGQYLQPSNQHAPIINYIPQKTFNLLKKYALQKGLKHVEASAMVRSSYYADKSYLEILKKFT